MKTERETTRIVRSWLEVGANRLPDRVLDSVLDQLPTHRQRRRPLWWPTRRFEDMNGLTKMAIAAAAVLVVLIAGYRLLPRNGPGGQATPTPNVTPAPSPSESLPAGSHTVTDTGVTLVPYTFSVPAGWIRDDGGARRGPDGIDSNATRLGTWIITDVYADSCHWTDTLAPATDTASLVEALTAQVGHTASAPVETTIGGLAATKITLSLDAAFDVSTCDIGGGNPIVRLWPGPGADETSGWLISPGQTDTAFVIEAQGKVMVLMTVQRNDSPPADVTALQQILDSVIFQP